MGLSRYDRYRAAVDGAELPLAYVDRDALETNIERTRRRASGTRVRVASKSIRCRGVLEDVLAHDGFEGVMCYTGHEAVHLADHGFDDLLVAYPVWHDEEIAAVCDAIDDGTRILLMVDDVAHVDRIGEVATERGVEVPLCLDVDMSTEHAGIHFGVRRSGVQTPEAALGVARAIADTTGVALDGVMGYEAQLAGLPDDDPSENAVTNAVIRRLKRRSAPTVRERRASVVAALEREGFDLSVVNGGGTGCVEETIQDASVTEVTVGSGFYAPTLFDHYRDLQYEPAAGYAIEIVRQPTADVYTCRGGGYVASGPPGIDKAPSPALPEGASLLSNEGAGEVQTPIEYDGPVSLELGDPVFFRHAKAGELCRNFRELQVVSGDEVVDSYATYRGDGRCFL